MSWPLLTFSSPRPLVLLDVHITVPKDKKQNIPRKNPSWIWGPRNGQSFFSNIVQSEGQKHKRRKVQDAVRFSSQFYDSKKTFFQIPKRQKKIGTELTVLGKQQSQEVGSAKPQDTAHPKRTVFMFPDNTVGCTLRQTHKPAKAHRISEINKISSQIWWIQRLQALEILYRVWLGKENLYFQEYGS